MNNLVNVVNVFGLLSLVAVGGGVVTLPQMEHEVVGIHKWVTAEQFTTIYSLGQLAPGSSMTMVSLIGYHAAGLLGFVAALLAFYIPSSLLVYFAAELWDKYAGSPWRVAIQRGLEPLAIGFMFAGIYAMGKTASFNLERPLWFNGVTLGIGLVVALILWRWRINPTLLIIASAGVGWFFLR